VVEVTTPEGWETQRRKDTSESGMSTGLAGEDSGGRKRREVLDAISVLRTASARNHDAKKKFRVLPPGVNDPDAAQKLEPKMSLFAYTRPRNGKIGRRGGSERKCKRKGAYVLAKKKRKTGRPEGPYLYTSTV